MNRLSTNGTALTTYGEDAVGACCASVDHITLYADFHRAMSAAAFVLMKESWYPVTVQDAVQGERHIGRQAQDWPDSQCVVP
jgi:hypothetical protein